MSLVERCCSCDALVTRCCCDDNPIVRAARDITDQDPERFGLVDPKDPPELRPENAKGWNLGE